MYSFCEKSVNDKDRKPNFNNFIMFLDVTPKCLRTVCEVMFAVFFNRQPRLLNISTVKSVNGVERGCGGEI